MSLVSVIVPTSNSQRTLSACLASVRNQSHPTVELIVVDNRSSDRTVDLARKFADRVIEWGPERSAQRNKGARLARGEYFLFIDSDMILSSDVISECTAMSLTQLAPGVVIPEISVGDGFWAHCRQLERSLY